MRKCQVMLDLGMTKDCEKCITDLESIAFQQERSHAIYTEINSLRERLQDPVKWRENQI